MACHTSLHGNLSASFSSAALLQTSALCCAIADGETSFPVIKFMAANEHFSCFNRNISYTCCFLCCYDSHSYLHFFSGQTVVLGLLITDGCSVLFLSNDAEISIAGRLQFSFDQHLCLSWIFFRAEG